MKYIFVAGAPGSKWSSVVKNIYYSPSIDQSDYSDARTYYHDASGKLDLMHLGVYFDPGMEYGGFFDKLSRYTKSAAEAEFDAPFSGTGTKIIKSHVFAHNVDYLKKNWPDCPVILVHRPDDACLGWWVKCGHFNISYPLYHEYYKDLRHMATVIKDQNRDILDAWQRYTGTEVQTNKDILKLLELADPPAEYVQDYTLSDVRVKVI